MPRSTLRLASGTLSLLDVESAQHGGGRATWWRSNGTSWHWVIPLKAQFNTTLLQSRAQIQSRYRIVWEATGRLYLALECTEDVQETVGALLENMSWILFQISTGSDTGTGKLGCVAHCSKYYVTRSDTKQHQHSKHTHTDCMEGSPHVGLLKLRGGSRSGQSAKGLSQGHRSAHRLGTNTRHFPLCQAGTGRGFSRASRTYSGAANRCSMAMKLLCCFSVGIHLCHDTDLCLVGLADDALPGSQRGPRRHTRCSSHHFRSPLLPLD